MAHVQRRCQKCRRAVPPKSKSCPSCGERAIRWRARYRGPDGRERSKLFDRRIDAERWGIEKEGSKHRGEWVDPDAGRLSLGDFSDEWLDAVVHLRPSTRYRYRSLFDGHI